MIRYGESEDEDSINLESPPVNQLDLSAEPFASPLDQSTPCHNNDSFSLAYPSPGDVPMDESMIHADDALDIKDMMEDASFLATPAHVVPRGMNLGLRERAKQSMGMREPDFKMRKTSVDEESEVNMLDEEEVEPDVEDEFIEETQPRGMKKKNKKSVKEWGWMSIMAMTLSSLTGLVVFGAFVVLVLSYHYKFVNPYLTPFSMMVKNHVNAGYDRLPLTASGGVLEWIERFVGSGVHVDSFAEYVWVVGMETWERVFGDGGEFVVPM
jgi:hypothetical protein